MDLEQRAVQAFHAKHSFPIAEAIGTFHQEGMTDIGSALAQLSKAALTGAESRKPADLGMVRMHLILEEAAELCDAIANSDKVAAADALGDLLYVVLGAAVSWDIPLGAVFWEIQKSNMTKAVRDPRDTRLRNKGDSYVPPDVQGAMEKGLGTD